MNIWDLRQHTYKDDFELILRRRNLQLSKEPFLYNDPNVIKFRSSLPTGTTNRTFFDLLGNNTFRKILGDIFYQTRTYEELSTRCSNREILNSHLNFMQTQEIVIEVGGKWTKSASYQDVQDISRTLEWYVAEWFRLELQSPARHGVFIKGIADGGDLDVVAFVEGRSIFIECKSGDPANINERHMELFLQRVADFMPSIALLLFDNDKQLDQQCEMMKKVYALSDSFGPGNSHKVHLDAEHIFIKNTKKGIAKSLNEILNTSAANEHHDRPLLTVTSEYVHRTRGTLPGLGKLESLVVRLIYEKAKETDDEWVYTSDILQQAQALGISEEIFFEFIEVLEQKNYILRKNIVTLKITVTGFEEYAKVCLPDYLISKRAVASLIVESKPIPDNRSISTSLNHPQWIVDHILESLASKGLIKITHYVTRESLISITEISAELKRDVREGKEIYSLLGSILSCV